MQKIIKKFKEKKAVIGIIGLGYVGIPLVICYKDAGYNVIGFDIDEEKIKKLKNKETYIKHISDDKISEIMDNGFEPTTDFSKIKDVDAIIICVPTPLDKYRNPDLSYIIKTMDTIRPYLKENQILSLESTTYPGTTDEEIVTRIESKGFKVGENFYVVYSPEREDPGNENFNTQTIPKVLGGYTENCKALGIDLYSGIINKIVPVSSTRTAEMVKLLENIHRSVNIGLVNEMKIITDKMGIDIHEVIKGASSKPFGFTAYYPGPGVGGHCIPIDPFYLTWKAKEYDVHTRFIELAGEINNSMPEYVVSKVVEGLNSHEKSLNKANILVLGISYKKNVDDARESPSVEIMNILKEKGAIVNYSDSYFPQFPHKREYNFDLSNIELTKENISSFDCIVLATAHDDFDYDLIKQNAKLIIDTRGKYQEQADNIIKA